MKLLRYTNRKDSRKSWIVRDQGQMDRSFLALFNYLDAEWNVYDDVDEDYAPTLNIPLALTQSSDPDSIERRARIVREHKIDRAEWEAIRSLYLRAKSGDAVAARKLVQGRNGGEYEKYTIEDLEEV